jgi:fucose 4-O-acetylase-like acetyltransferase
LPSALQGVFLWLDGARDVMTPLIVKWTLEPVRLVTALVWFTALYVWVRQHEAAINRASRGFFRILGERSLVVYVVHSVVIFALLLVIPGDHGFWLNNLLTAAVVALVYSLAAAHARLAKRSKRIATEGLRRLQLRNEDSL